MSALGRNRTSAIGQEADICCVAVARAPRNNGISYGVLAESLLVCGSTRGSLMIRGEYFLKVQRHKMEVVDKGFTVIRNALSTSQIRTLRNACEHYFSTGPFIYFSGGKARINAFSEPRLRNTLLLLQAPLVTDVIKQLCDGSVRYCDQSDVFLNVVTAFHRDNLGLDASFQTGKESYESTKSQSIYNSKTKAMERCL